ncbi:MAG: PepSY domain-containing protein [Cognaticolwellia sp.]
MKSRKLHKIIGLILLLPMLGWTVTGLVFFIKPGYQGAYQQLSVKTQPLKQALTLTPQENWQEAKLLTTILGDHLLVKSDNSNLHLDPISLTVKAPPSEHDFTRLLNDAFTRDSQRYGEIVSIEGLSAKTNTGVEVTLNWHTLRLSQKGQDTALINLLYQVHYLQWTPHTGVNQVLGISGLILLLLLSILGLRIYIKQRD